MANPNHWYLFKQAHLQYHSSQRSDWLMREPSTISHHVNMRFQRRQVLAWGARTCCWWQLSYTSPKCLGFSISSSCCHPSSAPRLSSVPREGMAAGVHSISSRGCGKTGLAAKITCCHGNIRPLLHKEVTQGLVITEGEKWVNLSLQQHSGCLSAAPWSREMLGGVLWWVRESPPCGFMGLWQLCHPVLSAGTLT